MLPLDTRSLLQALALGIVAALLHARIRRYLEVRTFRRVNSCQPPIRAPQPERILGLAAYKKLRRNRSERISLSETLRRALEIGRTNTAVVIGQEIVSTCDPENIKTVLATNFSHYGVGPRIQAMGPLLGKGIFTLDDVPWQHSRALIRPAFTHSQVADLSSLETHVQALISCLPTRDGTTVDLQPLFFNLTIDSASDFLFGQSMCCQGSASDSPPRRFSEAFDYAEAVLDQRGELGTLAWLVQDSKFEEACRIVHHVTDSYISEALKGGTKPGRYNLLAELAQVCHDPVRLREELLNVLIAARDTTAGLLSSIFHLLAHNLRSWDRLSREVRRLGGQVPDYRTLKDMRYLKGVLSETLRLLPPVPVNMRFARTDTVLPHGGGPDGLSPIHVAKGSRVFYSIWAMHRLPEIWGDDAESFRPERWLDEEVSLRPGWGYLPFNGGPRVCLGQQHAQIEASYIVVRLLQTFERIEPRDSRPWQEKLAVTLSSLHGTKVALWKWGD
ncbi:hypothetical protein HIM_12003 [Hirsutella minnesotensis 3608]|uniref:Cytochrome P450 52A13 n=1 Tax=Hirsutella minnesotensis 3608 TaxID=1043627 RepID=A0A0F7ZIH5_9HYPO|nr:hypothetical protein HIM_12003 [Hirsutella minnesotensis 3608]